MPALLGYLYIDRMNLWYPLQTFGADSLAGFVGKLTIVALFPDMALLFLFYTTDTWRLAKGVVIGMFPYIIAALWIAI